MQRVRLLAAIISTLIFSEAKAIKIGSETESTKNFSTLWQKHPNYVDIPLQTNKKHTKYH